MDKEKRINILKCILVILVVVIPNIRISISAFLKAGPENIFFNAYSFDLSIYSAISWLIMSLQYAFPVLLVIIISNESFKDFGFNKISIKDAAKALLRLILFLLASSVIFGVIYVCILFLFFKDLIYDIYNKTIFMKNIQIQMFLINILPIMLASFTEELCFRSYLYTYLNKIIKSKWVCIFIISLLFSSYHIYQGILGVISAFIFGLICNIEYKNHKNIYTIGIFHAIKNIISLAVRVML
jgi:membrane protease YdiL (CAAX protease family)